MNSLKDFVANTKYLVNNFIADKTGRLSLAGVYAFATASAALLTVYDKMASAIPKMSPQGLDFTSAALYGAGQGALAMTIGMSAITLGIAATIPRSTFMENDLETTMLGASR